jgi:hypothetical protein
VPRNYCGGVNCGCNDIEAETCPRRTYAERKEELRAARNAAEEAFETWRTCSACAHPAVGYCAEHSAALDRYRGAKRALRKHIEGPRA